MQRQQNHCNFHLKFLKYLFSGWINIQSIGNSTGCLSSSSYMSYTLYKTKSYFVFRFFDTQSYPCQCQISLTLYIFCFFHVVHHHQMAWYVKVYYVILFYSVN